MKALLMKWLILLPIFIVLNLLLPKIKPISDQKRRKLWQSIPAFFILDGLHYLARTYFPSLSNWLLISLACLIGYGIIKLILLPALLLPADKEKRYHKFLTGLLLIIWLGISWLVLN